MKKILVISLAVIMLMSQAIGVAATDFRLGGDGYVTINDVTIDGASQNGEFGLVIIEGLNKEVLDLSDENLEEKILYIDQATAVGNVISFGKFGLRDTGDEFAGATAFVGGFGLQSATAIGNIVVGGASSDAVPGDMDGSGEFDEDDAIHLLFNCLFGAEDYPITLDPDVDGSGEFDEDDAIHLLFNCLFGEEDYPLYPTLGN
ncbi:MAG: hypothetical protein E7393_01030 [Ruminococcaceae bacterium]|nr:hypothetical protein [Oscillospiraceae bacterium]